MANDVKQRMIEQAVILLARKGFQGASFSEILDAAGAPRGSLYHHFPGGKEELVLAAMDHAGRRAMAALEPLKGQPADKVAEMFLATWAAVLTRSELLRSQRSASGSSSQVSASLSSGRSAIPRSS